ncbi:hypothetical protein AB0M86_48015, partial [Streptomyces sp. NPDC051639]|uniref:hypothetical protein n=1 Tax=Streptomyces sp. NPDC051639 TaxID=3155671 RepID=UPI00343B256D
MYTVYVPGSTRRAGFAMVAIYPIRGVTHFKVPTYQSIVTHLAFVAFEYAKGRAKIMRAAVVKKVGGPEAVEVL